MAALPQVKHCSYGLLKKFQTGLLLVFAPTGVPNINRRLLAES